MIYDMDSCSSFVVIKERTNKPNERMRDINLQSCVEYRTFIAVDGVFTKPWQMLDVVDY